MSRTRPATIMTALAVAVLLAAGTWYLLALRFSTGDVFPPYSSLRADPLGGKVLYDALERLEAVKVVRHYSRLEKLEGDPAVLILGHSRRFSSDLTGEVDGLARRGARVVLAVRTAAFPKRYRPRQKDEADGGEGSDNEGNPSGEEEAGQGSAKHDAAGSENPSGWAVYPARSSDEDAALPPEMAELSAEETGLPNRIPVYSAQYFEGDGDGWRTIYETNAGPAVMEKSEGDGSVVLLAESYLLSNEAMRDDLHPALVAWLLGGRSQVVFVETHLGVADQPGVMSMARKYRLTALLGALLLVFALFIWSRQVPLLRKGDRDGAAGVASGKDQFSGMVNLLQRNIPGGRVLETCRREWERYDASSMRRQSEAAGVIADRIRPGASPGDPAAVYNSITRVISERNIR